MVFSAGQELAIVPSGLVRLVTAPVPGGQTDRAAVLAEGRDARCFRTVPRFGRRGAAPAAPRLGGARCCADIALWVRAAAP